MALTGRIGRGLLILAVGLVPVFWAAQAPVSFIHPDEQTAANQALVFLGRGLPIPDDLEPDSSYFVPYNTIHDPRNPLLTGFHSAGSIGFAYPLYLAPFVALGWPYLSGALALVGLYLGSVLFLDPRRESAWFLSLVVVAIPPVAMHATMLFSNLPGLALYVLGIGCIAHGIRLDRMPWIAAGLAIALASAAVRRDYLVSAPLLLILVGGVITLRPSARAGRGSRWRAAGAWTAALAVSLVVAGSLFWWANGEWGLPYAHTPEENPGTDLSTLSNVEDHLAAEIARRWGSNQEELLALTQQNYLFGFAPALLVLGGLTILAPTTRRGLWLLLPLAIHGGVIWLLSAGTIQYGTGCACVDASHPRYFFPIYATLALAGVSTVQALLGAWPRLRTQAILAASIAALLVVPSLAHAYWGEQGVEWGIDRRAGHDVANRQATQLPGDAILIGDYLSKIVYTRPVLVPDRAAAYLPDLVAKYRTELGRPAFVNIWMAERDEVFPYGAILLQDGRFTLRASGVGDLYEVVLTNATLIGVFALAEGEWAPAGNLSIRAGDRAHFRPVDAGRAVLPLGDRTVANGTVRITYYEPEPGRPLHFGFASGEVLGSWNSTASGEWRTAEVRIPAGREAGGGFFLEGFGEVHRLEVRWG